MTISNALIFIERGQKETYLRERLNNATTFMELESILEEENLKFSCDEFEEAFNLKVVRCQELEEAEQLKGFKMWWNLLHKFLQPNPGGQSFPGHSDPYI